MAEEKFTYSIYRNRVQIETEKCDRTGDLDACKTTKDRESKHKTKKRATRKRKRVDHSVEEDNTEQSS